MAKGPNKWTKEIIMKGLSCSEMDFNTLVQETVSYLQQQNGQDRLKKKEMGRYDKFINELIANHTDIFDHVPIELSWYDDRGRAFLRYAKQRIAKSTCSKKRWASERRSQPYSGHLTISTPPGPEHLYTLQVTRGLPHKDTDMHLYTIKGLVEASTGGSDPPVSDITISNVSLVALKGWLQQENMISSEDDELWGITVYEGLYRRISLDKHLHEFLYISLNFGLPKGSIFVKAAEVSSLTSLIWSSHLLTSSRCLFLCSRRYSF